MLVLSRKKNESIMIGDHIEVKILSVDGDQVKLGIVAPKSVKVHRSEVFEAIQEQNKEALNTNVSLLEQLKKK
ncbi:carbon storage regulator CsrA [Ureibacillus massiliensis 4400831 = CIP 108448 = CCUG 49529]|uniref:Translational regulator CsrA n=1 Tax=Ureibacillus massiliensis 4400831 = CIP 108448 = CCUG 49529 TaxID=1211035 RepID=A0A0A3IZD7_9BACL|nr:carbon storage regulator CsrA [Ureibacillus massiliensis]KGR90086.1 carbon storage regulator CsrA [Ureibacillus massiliensis 4400831 = CIP 108448 = CCUG 49529]BDH60794.1 carbon storage regulator [Lysinibacillus sp. PLM2]